MFYSYILDHLFFFLEGLVQSFIFKCKQEVPVSEKKIFFRRFYLSLPQASLMVKMVQSKLEIRDALYEKVYINAFETTIFQIQRQSNDSERSDRNHQLPYLQPLPTAPTYSPYLQPLPTAL